MWTTLVIFVCTIAYGLCVVLWYLRKEEIQYNGYASKMYLIINALLFVLTTTILILYCLGVRE